MNNNDLTDGLDEIEAGPTPARGPQRTSRSVHEPRSFSRGGATALGRDGSQLRRTRKSGIDQFHIDTTIVPKGWTYQWNVVTVTGNPDVVHSMNMEMAANGWKPVPADRHPGIFMPIGAKGERLEERPEILTAEAKWEDEQNAKNLVRDRNESLKLTKVSSDLPSGYAPLQGSQRRMLRTGGDNVRMSIDPSLDQDVPRPTYQPPED
jgi:uncharacterized Zn-finger protein